MNTRVGTKTAGSIIADVNLQLNSYPEKKVSDAFVINIINQKTDLLNELFSSKDKDVYKTTIDLPTIAESNVWLSSPTGVVSQDSEGRYVVVDFQGEGQSAGVGVGGGGSTISLAGGMFFFPLTLCYESVFISGTYNTQSHIGHGILKDEVNPQVGGQVYIFLPSNNDEVDLSAMSLYPYLDSIVSIKSSQTGKSAIICENIDEFNGMVSLINYNYASEVIALRYGGKILFAKGNLVPSYGTRTMYYIRKPYHVEGVDDVIDIPNSNVDLLKKQVMLDILQILSVPIPNELSASTGQISAMREAKDKEYQELLNKKA